MNKISKFAMLLTNGEIFVMDYEMHEPRKLLEIRLISVLYSTRLHLFIVGMNNYKNRFILFEFTKFIVNKKNLFT